MSLSPHLLSHPRVRMYATTRIAVSPRISSAPLPAAPCHRSPPTYPPTVSPRPRPLHVSKTPRSAHARVGQGGAKPHMRRTEGRGGQSRRTRRSEGRGGGRQARHAHAPSKGAVEAAPHMRSVVDAVPRMRSVAEAAPRMRSDARRFARRSPHGRRRHRERGRVQAGPNGAGSAHRHPRWHLPLRRGAGMLPAAPAAALPGTAAASSGPSALGPGLTFRVLPFLRVARGSPGPAGALSATEESPWGPQAHVF